MPKIEKIGYTRVSTRDQEPENQIRLIKAENIPEDYIFVDRGISGTIPAENRPGFKRAMVYIGEHPGEVKYMYIYEISRLGRNMMETAGIIEKLERMGILVWPLSPNEAFLRQEDRSIRQLLIMLMAWVAQRERENLVERTKAGLDRARAEGKLLGRPKAEIDWEKLRIMRAEGKSWDEISDEIGYSPMTIYRARKRRGEL